MSAWHVKLPHFEGPMDLLLFLVTKQEYDILDLPISEITESYMGVIDSIGVENLEDAGEYLLMAATLIAIKAKMLLPRPAVAGTPEEVDDPRHELAQRLLLYQKTKEEAIDLARRESEMAERFEIGKPATPPVAELAPEDYLVQMAIYDLTRAIEDIMRRKDGKRYHQVRLDKITLDERIRWVLKLLEETGRFGFVRSLQEELERTIWVVTFLAILEMTKRQRIHVEQNDLFTEIYVSRATVPELEAA